MFPPSLRPLPPEKSTGLVNRLHGCFGELPLGWSLSGYVEAVWEEFSEWFARMGPEEYLVLAGMTVVISFFLLFSSGIRR